MPSPRYWREVPARFRLEASRCGSCGKVSYPARQICPACRGKELEPTRLTPRGSVVTSTVVHVAPDDLMMEAPYAMALVETPEGPRLMMQVVDCDPSKVLAGMEVKFEFRKIRKEGHSGIRATATRRFPRSWEEASMKKVSVCIDLDDDKYRDYEAEAKRRGKTIEELVKHAVELMFIEQEERLKEEEDDHPIHIS